MTLAEAQSALESLETALHAGILTAERGGRRLTYQSADQMRAEANRLRRDIQHAQGKPSVKVAVWEGSK